MATAVQVRESLKESAIAAMDWFLLDSTLKDREAYFAKGKLGDIGTGAVYVYFDKNKTPLYVGEAGRPIKRRMHDQTSPHKNKDWWKSWTTVRFLQIPNQTDRLTLELLLILSLNPSFNSKPGPRMFADMFLDAT